MTNKAPTKSPDISQNNLLELAEHTSLTGIHFSEEEWKIIQNVWNTSNPLILAQHLKSTSPDETKISPKTDEQLKNMEEDDERNNATKAGLLEICDRPNIENILPNTYLLFIECAKAKQTAHLAREEYWHNEMGIMEKLGVTMLSLLPYADEVSKTFPEYYQLTKNILIAENTYAHHLHHMWNYLLAGRDGSEDKKKMIGVFSKLMGTVYPAVYRVTGEEVDSEWVMSERFFQPPEMLEKLGQNTPKNILPPNGGIGR